MATTGLNTFTYYSIFLVLILTSTAEMCSEPWLLQRNTTDPIFIGFTNGTFPGRYTSLLWHWAGTETKGEWETTLWKSFVTDNWMGSMAFRDGDGKVPVSLMWRYQTGNLTWLSRSNPLTDINWSIKVCDMPAWSFDSNELGNWTFKLGNIQLQESEGEKIISNFDEIMATDSENFIRSQRKRRHFLRIGQHEGNGERAWEIVREILDRVFGTSETIKEEGWISHITNFLYLIASAFAGSTSNNEGSGSITTRPLVTTTTLPDVETFNPTDLNAIRQRNTNNRKSRASM